MKEKGSVGFLEKESRIGEGLVMVILRRSISGSFVLRWIGYVCKVFNGISIGM